MGSPSDSDSSRVAESATAAVESLDADIATQWFHALTAVGNSAASPSWTRELLHGLASMIVSVVARPGDARRVGAVVGGELVAGHFTHTETIAVTIEVAQRLLPERFGPSARAALFAGMAEGYAHALRERVYAEQEWIHRALRNAYQAGNMRLHAAFHSMAVGVVVTDESGRITDANDAIGRILGLDAESLRKSNIRDLPGLCELPEHGAAFEALLTGRRAEHCAELRFDAPNGQTVDVRVRASMLPATDGAGTLVVAVEDIGELQELDQRLLERTTCDPLTGLPNRARLVEELAAVDRVAGPSLRVGLCLIDLDGFTSINDALGHQGGDRLLAVVAARLDAITDPRLHLVARTGADEFTILLRDCDALADLTGIAQRALSTVQEPVEIDGHRLHVTASAGLVQHRGDHADPTELLRAGESALSAAKSGGRGRWAVFEPARHAQQLRRRTLTQQLPAAIERGELFLEYQPIVDLADGGVRRMEALVRWNHPTRGRLNPVEFVPLAEESGAIVALGRWVLGRAVADAATWPAAPDGRRVEVAVNVAVRQLHEPQLYRDVTEVLAEAQLPAELLYVEITESEAIARDEGSQAVQTLQALAELGVGIAIDDFGTGYSNLAYLHRLPVRTLKIDQSFIAALAETGTGTVDSVVAGLINMAHACGLTVTAEGVQTREQMLRLRALGAETAQGFLLGRPAPESRVPALLAAPAVI